LFIYYVDFDLIPLLIRIFFILLLYFVFIFHAFKKRTGASAGFGEAAAKQFAACGSNLIITARRFDRLQALKKVTETTQTSKTNNNKTTNPNKTRTKQNKTHKQNNKSSKQNKQTKQANKQQTLKQSNKH
jgi:hypothetical protein